MFVYRAGECTEWLWASPGGEFEEELSAGLQEWHRGLCGGELGSGKSGMLACLLEGMLEVS